VPPLTRISVPEALPRARVRNTKCDTDAMLGSASPRKPSVRIAPRSSGLEIVGAPELARRVPLDRQPRILGIHPLAIVFNAQQLLSAELDRDRDALRAGIQRVLDQLLDDRGRTLDDFACSDLIRQVERKQVYAGHDYCGLWVADCRFVDLSIVD